MKLVINNFFETFIGIFLEKQLFVQDHVNYAP